MEVPGQPGGAVLQCEGVPLAPGKGWHLNPAVQGCFSGMDLQHPRCPGDSGDPGGSVSPPLSTALATHT